MLYQIGPLTIDTAPFNADSFQRSAGADFAEKPLMNALPAREFMGEGDDTLDISGQLLPFKIGGLSELETAHAMRRAGEALPVMRGDGTMLGWFVLTKVSEDHSHLMRDGVGFVVRYAISLARVDASAGSASIVRRLLSVFGI